MWRKKVLDWLADLFFRRPIPIVLEDEPLGPFLPWEEVLRRSTEKVPKPEPHPQLQLVIPAPDGQAKAAPRRGAQQAR